MSDGVGPGGEGPSGDAGRGEIGTTLALPSCPRAEGPATATADGPLGSVTRTGAAADELSSDSLLVTAPRIWYEGKLVPSLGGIPLLGKLGQGGMGAVYYGIHPKLKISVAVKVLPLQLAGQHPEAIKRFHREALVAKDVHSPHLIGVLDLDEEGGLLYIAMEFVDGVSLGAYLQQVKASGRRALREADALDTCIAATEGLAAAHEQGIVHRDVKPDNILLPKAKDGSGPDFKAAKLADLGLARSENIAGSLTASQSMMGSPGYMSPEQATNAKAAGKPADIFSMGATLYALLAGQAPFHGDTPLNAVMSTVQKPHTPLREECPAVSAATAALVDRCLAKDPAQRYPDAAVLLGELRKCREKLVESSTTDALASPFGTCRQGSQADVQSESTHLPPPGSQPVPGKLAKTARRFMASLSLGSFKLRVFVAFGVAVVLLGGLAFWGLRTAGGRSEMERYALKRPPKRVVQETHVEELINAAAKALSLAKDSGAQGALDEALAKLRAAKELIPDYPGLEALDEQLDDARRAVARHQVFDKLLAEAGGALGKGEASLADAEQALDRACALFPKDENLPAMVEQLDQKKSTVTGTDHNTGKYENLEMVRTQLREKKRQKEERDKAFAALKKVLEAIRSQDDLRSAAGLLAEFTQKYPYDAEAVNLTGLLKMKHMEAGAHEFETKRLYQALAPGGDYADAKKLFEAFKMKYPDDSEIPKMEASLKSKQEGARASCVTHIDGLVRMRDWAGAQRALDDARNILDTDTVTKLKSMIEQAKRRPRGEAPLDVQ